MIPISGLDLFSFSTKRLFPYSRLLYLVVSEFARPCLRNSVTRATLTKCSEYSDHSDHFLEFFSFLCAHGVLII